MHDPPQKEPWTGTFVPPRLAPGEMDSMLDRMKMFGLDGGPGFSDLPTQDELEALTPEELWVRLKGETPLEFLVRMYRNPWIPMSQRLGAASKVMDYVHKQKAKQLDAGANGLLMPGGLLIGGLGPIDPRRLSDEQLSELDALLSKARGTQPAAASAVVAEHDKTPPHSATKPRLGGARRNGDAAQPSAGAPARRTTPKPKP